MVDGEEGNEAAYDMVICDNPPGETQRTREDNTVDLANEEQRAAIDAVCKRGENVFITGSGGTGKSFVIKRIIAELDKDCCVVVTCPTHHAAAVLKDQEATTYHKFFKCCYDGDTYSDHHKKKLEEKVKRNKLVLIFDEISMISASRLDYIDILLRKERKKVNSGNANKPFGGAQTVFVGDFYQIPPVVKSDRRQGGICPNMVVEKGYAFESHCYHQLDPKMYELTISKRLTDSEDSKRYFDILTEMRSGNFSNKLILKELCAEGKERARLMQSSEATWLYVKNRDVESKNKEILESLEGVQHNFGAYRFAGPSNPMVPHAEHLRFVGKIGAAVMLRDNCKYMDVHKELHNIPKYSRGLITNYRPFCSEVVEEQLQALKCKHSQVHQDLSMARHKHIDLRKHLAAEIDHLTFVIECLKAGIAGDNSLHVPEVKFDGIESRVLVLPRKLEKDDAIIIHLPLILGWAMTIHKSQGKSISLPIINAEGCFTHGMGYVALSRVVDPKRSVIVTMPPDQVPNSKVVEFMSSGGRFHTRWTKTNHLEVAIEKDDIRPCPCCKQKCVGCEVWFNALDQLKEELLLGLGQEYRTEIEHLMKSLLWMGYRTISSLKNETQKDLTEIYRSTMKDYKEMLASNITDSENLQESLVFFFGKFSDTLDFKAKMNRLWREVPIVVEKILPSTPVTTQETPTASPTQPVQKSTPGRHEDDMIIGERSPEKRQRTDEGNTEYWVYVLKLREYKYYVGMTQDVEKRLQEHSEGGERCAQWTKKYPPLHENPYRKFGPFEDEGVALREENFRTAECMRIHQIDNVRGGDWANLALNEEQKRAITIHQKPPKGLVRQGSLEERQRRGNLGVNSGEEAIDLTSPPHEG